MPPFIVVFHFVLTHTDNSTTPPHSKPSLLAFGFIILACFQVLQNGWFGVSRFNARLLTCNEISGPG